MKVVSFNVNSIRSRMHQLAAVIKKHSPEIIALQETKVQDHEFPEADINDLGYHVVWFGQKTHYGVALMSRSKPENIQYGFDDDPDDAQRRFLSARYALPNGEAMRVLNGYFPQGENRDHPIKYPHKKRFYKQLHDHLQNKESAADYLIVVGDMNVAPEDTDIGIGEENARRWLRTGKCSFLPEEREWLRQLYDWGLFDTFKKCQSDSADKFSWFDYRSRGFLANPPRGLRIDLILASKPLHEQCVDVGIDYDIRGMEKPSDHAPVWAEFNIEPI